MNSNAPTRTLPHTGPGTDLRSPDPEALRLATTALALSALSAGFALAVNVVHYRTWSEVGAADFAAFQDASALHTVPAAAGVGLASLIWAVRTARRGLWGIRRWQLLGAAALAAVPWIATPVYFVPLQQRLGDLGPMSALLTELVWADLALRAVPPTLQTLLLARALRSHLSRAGQRRSPEETRT